MQSGGTYDLAAHNTPYASKTLMRVHTRHACHSPATIPSDEPVANPASTQLLAVDTNGRVATWRISINNIGVFISGRDIDGNPVASRNFSVDDRVFGTWAHIVLEVADDDTEVNWAVWI